MAIGDEPNGININLDCGSTATEELKRKVHETRADIGIALDGDADRVIIIDENSNEIDGDQLLATIGEYWNKQSRLSGGGIVATVMSNLGLERFLADRKLTLARTKVGDRYVVEHMRKHGFNLGGEQSGHMVLSDFATTGDGLVAALQVLAVMKTTNRPASEACRKFEPVPQLLQNVRFSGGNPLETEQVKQAIKDATQMLGNKGRLVIRPSGTEPLIRIMAECDDEMLVKNVVSEVAGAVSKAAA